MGCVLNEKIVFFKTWLKDAPKISKKTYPMSIKLQSPILYLKPLNKLLTLLIKKSKKTPTITTTTTTKTLLYYCSIQPGVWIYLKNFTYYTYTWGTVRLYLSFIEIKIFIKHSTRAPKVVGLLLMYLQLYFWSVVSGEGCMNPKGR